MSFHEEVISGFVTDRAIVSCGYCGVTAIYQSPENLNLIKSIEDGRIHTGGFSTSYFIDKLSSKYLYTDATTGTKVMEYTYKISPVWFELKNRKDVYLANTLEKCPCCGKAYDNKAVKDYSFWSDLCKELNIETRITPGFSTGYKPYYELGRLERDYQSIVNYNGDTETAIAIFEECEKYPAEYEIISGDAVKTLSVTDFIKIFIQTEAVISSCKERIKYLAIKGSLFALHSASELTDIYRKAFNKRIDFAIPLGEKRRAVLAKLESLNSNAPFNPDTVDLSDLPEKDVPEPQKPVVPVKPSEPLLQKVTLFNKAKATMYNEKQMAEYNANLQIYVNLASTYDERLAQYEKDYAEYMEKHNAYLVAKEQAIAKAEAAFEEEKTSFDKVEKIAVLETQLKEIEKEFDTIPEKALSAVLAKNEVDYFAAISAEMEQAKDLLGKACGARNYLKKCGVVHPKYANLVALTSIYEYYETGRTDTLTGQGGAYNLYEQEMQAQMIVNSLNNIADKLESIEEAQYSILYTIQDMKENTEKLLADIADSTARIAYNSAVTAHYAKLNSQLLNSVGMMIALK